MFTLAICLVFIIFKADASDRATDSLEITFEIASMKVENHTEIICDHNDNDKTHTVFEGDEFRIITKYKFIINHFFCSNYKINNYLFYEPKKEGWINVATFKVEKGMGALWNCTVLAHRDSSTILPVVRYGENTYSVAYCFMKMHVRQTESPQTILVNNMELEAVRTNQSEKNVDFTAEYQFVDGDVVNVTCVNFLNPVPLTMEYVLAGTMSDNSIMNELSSKTLIGFRVKLHSGHNNSYMICTNTEPTDYTKVMVKFVMRTEVITISVEINGLALRPKLKDVDVYVIEYIYPSHQLINLVCEVQRRDAKLEVSESFDFFGRVSSYKKTVLIPLKKENMSFYIDPTDDTKLWCLSEYINGGIAEQVRIVFTPVTISIDQYYPLHIELPSNGTVMEVFNNYKLKVIFYEFEDGETMQFKCVSPRLLVPGPLLCRQFNGAVECSRDSAISKILYLTNKVENAEITCYITQQHGRYHDFGKGYLNKLREIRLILRERVLTTTSTTTTPSSPVTALTTVITTTSTAATPASHETSTNTLVYYMSALGVAVFIIWLIILYLSVKKRGCCIRSSSQELPPIPTPRPDPNTVYYENLLSVFQPINEREAAEMENHYEEIQ